MNSGRPIAACVCACCASMRANTCRSRSPWHYVRKARTEAPKRQHMIRGEARRPLSSASSRVGEQRPVSHLKISMTGKFCAAKIRKRDPPHRLIKIGMQEKRAKDGKREESRINMRKIYCRCRRICSQHGASACVRNNEWSLLIS